MSHPAYSVGDVCLLDGDAHVVTAIGGGHAVLVPVRWHNSTAMRHDIRVRDLPDLAAMGLRGGYYVARPAQLRIAPLAAWERIGAMPAELLAVVQRGVRREAMDRQLERHYRRAAA